MEQPGQQSTPGSGQNTGRRDMMFCHVCNDEWYRDEHGLECPECGSDFTEIIEENNDPRDSVMFGDDGDDDDMPDLVDAGTHAHPLRNPFQNDDPEEGDISNVHFTQTAPGRFNVQATITRSVSPEQFRAAGGMAPASIGGFMAMLNGLTGAALRGQAQQNPQGQGQDQGQSQGQGQGLFSAPTQDQSQDQNQSAFQEARSSSPSSGPQFRTTRFQYSAGFGLHPRDTNTAGPRTEPVDDLTNILTGLMATLGAPPGSLHTHQTFEGANVFRFGNGGANDHDGPTNLHAIHPFAQLFSTLGMVGPTGQMGDFVYSQEGLDRIITQLMEQTASSNAPGPATQADIDALPRKQVDEEMLGAEHRAECSICMDEVNIGEEVTVLPCKHWFHHACIGAWLLEHDTCPHCRKGITKRDQDANPNQNTTQATSNAQTGTESQPTGSRSMPGAFEYSGSGTSSDPFRVGEPAQATGSDSAQANNSSSTTGANANAESSDGGIADQIRRRWFGPTQ